MTSDPDPRHAHLSEIVQHISDTERAITLLESIVADASESGSDYLRDERTLLILNEVLMTFVQDRDATLQTIEAGERRLPRP